MTNDCTSAIVSFQRFSIAVGIIYLSSLCLICQVVELRS